MADEKRTGGETEGQSLEVGAGTVGTESDRGPGQPLVDVSVANPPRRCFRRRSEASCERDPHRDRATLRPAPQRRRLCPAEARRAVTADTRTAPPGDGVAFRTARTAPPPPDDPRASARRSSSPAALTRSRRHAGRPSGAAAAGHGAG